MLMYLMIGVGILFGIIIIALLILQKNNKEAKYIKSLQQGTKSSTFSADVIYQKLYIFYLKTPFLKRYVLKIRRRLEIINIDDEYNTRKGTAKILTKTLAILVPMIVVTIIMTSSNYLLMIILSAQAKSQLFCRE